MVFVHNFGLSRMPFRGLAFLPCSSTHHEFTGTICSPRPSYISSNFFNPFQIPCRKRWLHNQQPVAPVHLQVSMAALSPEMKAQLLSGVAKRHFIIASKVLSQATSAALEWSVSHTDFLTPSAQQDALMVLSRLTDVGVIISGGYAQAERCRLTVGHAEAPDFFPQDKGVGYPGAVAAFRLSGNFSNSTANHRDFLGAVLNIGIKREKVGDIIVQGNRGAQVLIAPEMGDVLQYTSLSVKNVGVSVEAMELEELEVVEQKVSILTSVESSLRVDSLASAGFKISRSKLTDYISGGDVRVNWKDVSKNGVLLKTGDMVSVRGQGRLEIGDITITKKGRYAVELIRYL